MLPCLYNLKLHSLAVEFDGPDFLEPQLDCYNAYNVKDRNEGVTYKIHANRGDVAFRVGIVGESKEQARLSNTGVSNKQELEEIVVSISMISSPGDQVADRISAAKIRTDRGA